MIKVQWSKHSKSQYPTPICPSLPPPSCTHPVSQSRTRFCFHKKKPGGGTPPLRCIPWLGVCSPSARLFYAHRTPAHAPLHYLGPHHPQRSSPSRPGLSREGSQASPPPAATSSRTASSTGADECNNQVQGWGQKRGKGEGKRAGRATLPKKLSAASSQPAAVTNTKWRRGASSRRSDHHPPTKGARSGRP